MFRWLVDNLSTLALALILAVFVWFVAVQETNPIEEQTFRESVPVVMLNQPAGSIWTNKRDYAIEVVVRGPRQTLAALQPGQFNALIDLSTIPFGGEEVPVAVTVDDPLVQIVEQDTDQIMVRLEEYRSVTIPISPTLMGEPALGHVAGVAIVEPGQVTLEGPASVVDPIAEAYVRVSVEGVRETVQEAVTVRLRDSDGRLITGLIPEPTDAAVTVPIFKSDEYSELFVTLNLTGTIAAGYRLADYSVDPQRVTIFGPPEVVSALPGFVSTVAVDVSEADTDLIQRVGLMAPLGVTVIGESTVVVEIDIEPVVTTLTIPWWPEIRGLGPGLTSTISPETINVSLAGPLQLMEAFDPESDLSLRIDLSGKGVGSHPVMPVALSNVLGVEVADVLPSTVQVQIDLIPSPTPTPTPTITGTATLTGTLPITSTLSVPILGTPTATGTPLFSPTATPTLTPTP